MKTKFASRMKSVPRSFIREILKVTTDPEIISFAGGLPNLQMIPVRELEAAADKVFESDGTRALQYSTTEGYYHLREWICKRYLEKKGIKASPDDILITTGSQQALDLLSKVLIDKDDRVVIEKPGYLGAIQAMSVFQPKFNAVEVDETGVDTDKLEKVFKAKKPKLFYAVPNFQNPSGITYSDAVRKKTAVLCKKYSVLFVEDDPYGELRFEGNDMPAVKNYLGKDGVMFGSFSKIVAPGLRLGWVFAPKDIMERIVTVKQAADLHTNFLAQRITYQYLLDNSIDAHIEKLRKVYGVHAKAMLSAIEKYFPQEVAYTRPQGGMFIWATLPKGLSAMDMIKPALKDKVAFVPGDPFYTDVKGANTMRLNYSNAAPDVITEGIKRLGNTIKKLIGKGCAKK